MLRSEVVSKFVEFCKRLGGRIESWERRLAGGAEFVYSCILPRERFVCAIVDANDRRKNLVLEVLPRELGEKYERFELDNVDTILQLSFADSGGDMYYFDTRSSLAVIDTRECRRIDLRILETGTYEEARKKETVDSLIVALSKE